MTGQEWAVAAIGVAAVAWLAWRIRRRRRAGTCCGESECPATRRIVDRLDDADGARASE